MVCQKYTRINHHAPFVQMTKTRMKTKTSLTTTTMTTTRKIRRRRKRLYAKKGLPLTPSILFPFLFISFLLGGSGAEVFEFLKCGKFIWSYSCNFKCFFMVGISFIDGGILMCFRHWGEFTQSVDVSCWDCCKCGW